jgi:integrase
MRERGAGSIFKIKGCARWYVKIGRRRFATGTTSKMRAIAVLQEKIGQANNGTLTETNRLRYEDLRASLLAEYKTRGHRSLQTLSDGSTTIWGLKHLDKFFKHTRISAINTDKLRSFIAARQKQNADPGTINRNLSLLRRMMNLARQENKIAALPYFPMLAEGAPRSGFLEDAQFARLFSALPSHLKPLILFLYRTGCRLGEARSIEWEQLDLNAATVRLASDQTKSGEARTLPLPDELIGMLKKQRPKIGKVFSQGNFRKAWISACKKAKLGTVKKGKENGGYGIYRGLIVHDLRRSAIRNFVRQNVPEVVAMKISGHRTRAVFERYNIVSTGDLEKAMNAVSSSTEMSTNRVQIGKPQARRKLLKP